MACEHCCTPSYGSDSAAITAPEPAVVLFSTTNTYRRSVRFNEPRPVQCDVHHMSGSRESEHVITIRRPSVGIRWLVTHRESSTQVLAMLMRAVSADGASPSCTRSWHARSCSLPLAASRPTARHPAGLQT